MLGTARVADTNAGHRQPPPIGGTADRRRGAFWGGQSRAAELLYTTPIFNHS